MFKDVRAAMNLFHRDRTLKQMVANDPKRYIKEDKSLIPMFQMLRTSGFAVFLVTNILWEYTNAVMNFLCGTQNLDGSSSLTLDWLQYFDVVITGSAKPNFFHEENHSNLFAVDTDSGMLINTDNGSPMAQVRDLLQNYLIRYQINLTKSFGYQHGFWSVRVLGGNVGHLHKLLSIKSSSQVLNVGDHKYGEILRSKKVLGWRTMLVIPELEKEVKLLWNLRDTRKQLKLLRRERSQIEDQIHLLKWSLQCASLDAHETEKVSSKLGLLELQLERVRVTHQEAQKRFHEKVERFACLYTSQVGNLGLHSPAKYYRPDEDFMPHEYDVHSL